MKCAILQPSFLPWRGTFHILKRVDKFIVFDDVQYDKHGWRNRNRIKTANGLQWLTIPVQIKSFLKRYIKDIEISYSKSDHRRKIIKGIIQAYRKATHFYLSEEILSILERKYKYLIDLDMDLLVEIMKILRIDVEIIFSSDLKICYANKVERLVSICKEVGADHYISGPTARSYIKDESGFIENGIKLEFQEYDYPPYRQLYGEYISNLSIIDLLFNVGLEKAGDYIWNAKKD